MMIWLISNADYCAKQWAQGYGCDPPMSLGTWVVAILAWIIGFALVMKLLHYGITGTMKLFLGRPQAKSAEYQLQFAYMRTLVLRRDHHQCVVCGETMHLHVHHRIPRAQGGSNDASNLVTLCRFHHGQVHGRNWQ